MSDMPDNRDLLELRWASARQFDLSARVRNGAVLKYNEETSIHRHRGYYVEWVDWATDKPQYQYLGLAPAMVQYNLDQWIKQAIGVIARAKFR